MRLREVVVRVALVALMEDELEKKEVQNHSPDTLVIVDGRASRAIVLTLVWLLLVLEEGKPSTSSRLAQRRRVGSVCIID